MQENALVVLDGAVVLAGSVLLGDLHEEAGAQGAADVLVVLLVLKGRRDELDLLALHDALELHAHVVGLLQGAEGEEVVVAPLLGVLLRLGSLEGVVDVEHGEVVAVFVGEEVLHFVGAFASGGGADEDLGHRDEGRHGEHLVTAVEFGRADKHDCEGRVEREVGSELAELSKLSLVVQAGQVV